MVQNQCMVWLMSVPVGRGIGRVGWSCLQESLLSTKLRPTADVGCDCNQLTWVDLDPANPAWPFWMRNELGNLKVVLLNLLIIRMVVLPPWYLGKVKPRPVGSPLQSRIRTRGWVFAHWWSESEHWWSDAGSTAGSSLSLCHLPRHFCCKGAS